jgi:hypothetical protein
MIFSDVRASFLSVCAILFIYGALPEKTEHKLGENNGILEDSGFKAELIRVCLFHFLINCGSISESD